MTTTTAWRTPQAILISGALVLMVAFGVRAGFGLFLQPVTLDSGWGRETFAFTIALQNLIWGAAQPFTGMLADRIGAGRVIVGGAILYAVGLVLMAQPLGPLGFILSGGILVGLGLSGTTFPIVFGVISRNVAPEKRSVMIGIATAAGSFGQFVMLPGTFVLLQTFDWSGAFVVLAIAALVMIPIGIGLFEKRDRLAAGPAGPSAGEAIRLALRHRGFWLLALGFFVCGFQIIFISVHLPAYLADQGLSAGVGTTVLAVIGLVNVLGTYYAGLWGGRYRKPMLLAWIYIGRSVAIALFILMPLTTGSAYLFGVLMGLLWLSTVPLTNGTVASVFGVKNMSMLGGVVFFAHQVGAFLGGWLGGVIFDRLGSYDLAWGIAIALGVIAALLNIPISERSALTPATPVAPAAPAGAKP